MITTNPLNLGCPKWYNSKPIKKPWYNISPTDLIRHSGDKSVRTMKTSVHERIASKILTSTLILDSVFPVLIIPRCTALSEIPMENSPSVQDKLFFNLKLVHCSDDICFGWVNFIPMLPRISL